MEAVAARTVSEPTNTTTRDQVLARYRRLRRLCRDHHNAALGLLGGDVLLHQARRLGLARGRTLMVDDMDELFFAFDLAIHTAPPGRQRLIERYSRKAGAAAGSEEARMLRAMCDGRFTILRLERRHPLTGFWVLDTEGQSEHWLIDEGLEASVSEGAMIATRLLDLGEFCMTAGVLVPMYDDLFIDTLTQVPYLADRDPTDALADRRFAETLYRLALADGLAGRVKFTDAGPADAPALLGVG